jgi:hypothetical protein
MFKEGSSKEGEGAKAPDKSGLPRLTPDPEGPLQAGQIQRSAILTTHTHPMYSASESTIAGQKPTRGTIKIIAIT